MIDRKPFSINEELLLRETSRRGFLQDVLTASLLASGCSSSPQKETQAQRPDTRVDIKEVTPTLTKVEVRTLLEQLAPGPYKDFVMHYGYALFQDTPPKNITLAGAEIIVADSRVIDKEEQGVMGGSAALRIIQRGQRFRLQQDHSFSILLPHILETPDSLIRARIDFDANTDFAEGIEPQITWVSLKDGRIPLNQVDSYQRVRQFTIVKEAFGIAFLIAYLEEIIVNMNAQKMSIYFNDNGQKIEAVCQALVNIINSNGKFAALSDLTPFVLASKAMQPNQAFIDAMRKDPRNINTLDAISNRDFGSLNEMMGNSIKFILQNKDLVKDAGDPIGNLNAPY